MNLIVAVDKNWAIGNKGELLVRIPADHKMFRQETTGKVVVLGRKTMDTFPGGQPLKNRDNIILSRNEAYQQKDAQVVHSVEELLEAVKGYDTKEVYVIGVSSVYEQLLPYCDTAHVTKIDHAYEADSWFPNLDEDPDWETTADSDEQYYFDLTYHFLKYERKKGCGKTAAVGGHVRESSAATAFSNSSPIKNHAGAKSRRITWLMFQGLFW